MARLSLLDFELCEYWGKILALSSLMMYCSEHLSTLFYIF